MVGRNQLILFGVVAVGVFFGNMLVATNPEVGAPRPIQHGVTDLLNNSSWNQASYLAHEWWLANSSQTVLVEHLESSNNSREIILAAELLPDNVAFGCPTATLAIDWTDQTLVDVLYSHRATEDGHLIYCREEGMARRVFCSFNVFIGDQEGSDTALRLVGVDLGPFGVGLVETSLLDRLIKKYSASDVDHQGSPW